MNDTNWLIDRLIAIYQYPRTRTHMLLPKEACVWEREGKTLQEEKGTFKI
jgi:hypothetical protein